MDSFFFFLMTNVRYKNKRCIAPPENLKVRRNAWWTRNAHLGVCVSWLAYNGYVFFYNTNNNTTTLYLSRSFSTVHLVHFIGILKFVIELIHTYSCFFIGRSFVGNECCFFVRFCFQLKKIQNKITWICCVNARAFLVHVRWFSRCVYLYLKFFCSMTFNCTTSYSSVSAAFFIFFSLFSSPSSSSSSFSSVVLFFSLSFISFLIIVREWVCVCFLVCVCLGWT